MSPAPEAFPPTRWTAVELAGDPAHPGQEKALDDLLRQYLPALRAFLVAQFRLTPAPAEDLLQGFLLDRVVRGGVLSRADRRRGRFRTFLLQALTHYVISELRRAGARKRAPAGGTVSLDELVEEGFEVAKPPSAAPFDLAFARQVLTEALRRMENQCAAARRADLWGVFSERLLGPIFGATKALDYSALVERFGFQSPGHAANVLVTAKRMFVRVLRSVVAEYVSGEKEIEAELAELRAILALAVESGGQPGDP